MTGPRWNVLAFTTPAPGWRLWIVDPKGKPKEVPLAGWITLDVGTENTLGVTNQVICPGWYEHGQIITAMEYDHDIDVRVVAPGEPEPTADELTDWGERHMVKRHLP